MQGRNSNASSYELIGDDVQPRLLRTVNQHPGSIAQSSEILNDK